MKNLSCRRIAAVVSTLLLLIGIVLVGQNPRYFQRWMTTKADNTPQVLPLMQDWSNPALITVNDNWSGVGGIEGYLGQDITTATATDPQTLLGVSAVANDLTVLANQSSTAITAGDVAEFDGIANPTVALQGSGTADAPYLLFYLNTTGRMSVNVAYNLRDIDGTTDNAVQPVALQFRVGNTGNFTNVPTGFVADATTGPSLATLVTPVSATLSAAADNQALVQVRVITANAVGNDEWVGVDDINITSSPICPGTVVTNGNDGGAGSLRDVIANACAGATITFQAGVTTVTLTTAELVVNKNLTIDGGVGVTVTRLGGSPNFRIFNIQTGNTVSMNNLTVTNGNHPSQAGGMLNRGMLTMTNCTVSGNASPQGSGLQNEGTLGMTSCAVINNSGPPAGDGGGVISFGTAVTLTNCTVSGNQVFGNGGGVSIHTGTLAMTNCTVTNNQAKTGGVGGGLNVQVTSTNITLRNAVFIGNTGNGGSNEIFLNGGGAVNAASVNNLIGVSGTGGLINGVNGNQVGVTNALLGALAGNGGPTQTHALLPGSPAINAGTNTGAPATDQRGIARPQQTTTDIGAFESRGFTMALSSGDNQSATVNTNFASPLVAAVSSAFSEPVDGGRVTFTPPGSGASCTIAGSPATITSGTATSGTVTANATAGGPYTVTASANGSTSTNFSLTNTAAASADLAITKTDGVTTAVPGGSVTYTITASNAGPSSVTATVADTFPAILTPTWTCSGAGGGTCTGSGSGNISDTVNLPAGGSVTYTVTCTISPAATGTLSNTATVTSGVTDPVPGNNSATDTDTLTPQANLAITKTDGVTTALPGGSVTYTITASNAGPSNAPGATVADTFPASITSAMWSCVGAGGGTCTGSNSGNISDTVNLPAGGSVTYTVTCAISPAATGTLSNTATVAAPAGVTDPVPGNNSATDSDMLNCPSTVVTNGNDSGAGSLRNIIANACPGSTITFQAGVTTVTLTTAELLINKNLTINGGSGVTVTRSTAGVTPDFRIFNQTAGVLNVMGLTISNGNTAASGGGIGAATGTTLIVSNCVLSNNTTGINGGGIDTNGMLTVSNSTFSGNQAPAGIGGGLNVLSDGSGTATNCTFTGNVAGEGAGLVPANMVLTNCTITGNTATVYGGGALVYAPNGVSITLQMTNCTVSNNTAVRSDSGGIDVGSNGGTFNFTFRNNIFANNTPQNLYTLGGTVTSLGNNLSTDGTGGGGPGDVLNTNAVLGPLASNGGPTQTRALLPGSPAINAGTATGAPTTDQRGIARVGNVDIGAYESRGFTMSLSSGDNQSTFVGTNFGSPLAVTVSSAFSEPVNGGQVTFTPPVSGASCSIAGNPATMTSGTATSGTVTANATAGGPYTVSAAANGVATGINFSLTNLTVTVSSINRASANPTCVNTSVDWTVTFSMPVTGVTASNFQLVGGTGASITNVTGSGTTRTVTANSGTAATASLGLNMVNSTGVTPTVTGLPFTGQTYTVNGLPTTPNAGPDQTLCVTSSVATLAANAPSVGSGTWSVVSAPGGGSTAASQFSNTASPISTFTPSPVVSGTFTLRWTISNSPCAASTDDVNIVYNAAPTTANAGPDQTLCVTSPAATLAANSPTSGTGAWSVVSAPGGGSTSTSQFSSTSSPTATFTPSPAVAGAYTLRWTISNAPCPASTDDVVISYTAAPSTSNAGPDQTLCITSSVATLAANAPSVGSGTWSVVTTPGGGSTSSAQFGNTASPTSTFTPSPAVAGAYTLRWTISNSPCAASTDDVVITYRSAPTTSSAGPDQTLCVTSSATLAANSPSSGTGAWSVVNGPSALIGQFGNPASPTSTFTPAGGAGIYTLRWTISNSPCTASTDDMVITYIATPTTANAGPDQTLCLTFSAMLAANTPAAGSGTWSVAAGPSTLTSQFSGLTSPTSTFMPAGGAGVYTLRWTISNPPCAASFDDMTLTVIGCAEFSTLYVADTQNHRVQKFDGTTWTVVVGTGVPGIAANQCSLPEAVTASFDGQKIYVADTGNNRVTFSTNGGATWAVFASGPGLGLNQVNAPQGVALDTAGNLYVSDTGNRRVLKFVGGTPGAGAVLANDGIGAGQVKSPRGLAIDATGTLFVADRDNNRVLRIANAAAAGLNAGTVVASGPGFGLTQVSGPEGVAVDNAGNLYVADTNNDRVIQFPGGVAGTGTTMTAGIGVTLGAATKPEGVTVTRFTVGPFAGQPLLIVGDTGGNRVEGRPLAGGAWQLVGTPNGVGSGVGQFRNPSKIR